MLEALSFSRVVDGFDPCACCGEYVCGDGCPLAPLSEEAWQAISTYVDAFGDEHECLETCPGCGETVSIGAHDGGCDRAAPETDDDPEVWEEARQILTGAPVQVGVSDFCLTAGGVL